MSALNVWVSSDRAVMLTDTVLYNATGEITGFAQKAIPVQSWTGVIAGRGNVWGTIAATHVAEQFGSFDEFVARSGAILQAGHRDADAAGNLHGSSMVEVVVAGWSESRDRAMAFELNSVDAPAFVWRDVCAGEGKGFQIGPMIDERIEEWRLHRVGADPLDYEPRDFDPVKHGLPLMEAQRRSKTSPRFFPGEPFHAVGGAAWCSIVSRDGVEQSVIHDWCDEARRPIVPAPINDDDLPHILPSEWSIRDADVFWALWRQGLIDIKTLTPVDDATTRFDAGRARAASTIIPMNRAERRRAERQQRKLARAS